MVVLVKSQTVKEFNIPLAAWTKATKDHLADAADATNLGLADSAGALMVGTQTDGGVGGDPDSATETADTLFAMPSSYIDGQPVTFRVRAKVTVARNTSQQVDAVCKLVGDTLGAEICATAIQTVTTSFVNYDFTITPTTLTKTSVLYIQVKLAMDDTNAGTGSAGIGQISKTSVLCTVKGW